METLKLGSKGKDVVILQLKLNLNGDGIFGPVTKEAVEAFQKENNLTADGIVGSKTWEKLGVSTNKRVINEIIVHCTATPEGRDFDIKQIKKCHLERGFRDIGYHYVIYRDGSIHEGRKESIIGAHCTNHNAHSIGVCYVGGMTSDNKKPKDTRTEAQKVSLIKLLKELKAKYPKATIHGHCEFANKACPCFDAREEYKDL